MNTTIKTHIAMLTVATGVLLHAPAHAQTAGMSGAASDLMSAPSCYVDGVWTAKWTGFTTKEECEARKGGEWRDPKDKTVSAPPAPVAVDRVTASPNR